MNCIKHLVIGKNLSIMRCFLMGNYIIKKRVWVLFTIFIVLFSILYIRIFQFEYLSSKKLSVMADAQYSYRENIESLNFLLLDRNGKNLMSSTSKYYVVIIPNDFNSNDFDANSEDILTLVYTLRNYNNDYDISKLNLSNKGQKMYLEVDKSTYDKVKNIKNVKGVYAYTLSEMENKGSWNIESLLTNPRKLIDDSFKAEDSLEMKIYTKVKNNKKAQVVFEKDTTGNIISENIQYPKENLNVRLTIDKDIQQKISEVLQSDKYSSFKQVGVIMMEASSGKILGMVQKDNSLPNVNIGATTENGFYPGSIFKVIVEEAALKSNSIKLEDEFTCRGLYEDEHKNHGTLNSSEALVVSCNDIYAQIGSKTGYKAIYSLAQQQGLFSKVLGFDSELAGKIEIKEPKLSDGSISLVSMGQGMRITPIEAISISNTVVNEGIYVKPYLLDAYVDSENNGKEIINTEKKTIIDQSEALTIKNQMVEVVEEGTAQGAKLNGTQIGGKTGTTQRSQYSDGWFTGFFNVNGKNYSMIVFIEDIDKVKESGGTTAAPIFRDIVKETKAVLNN